MRRPSAAALATVGFALLSTPVLLVTASALRYLLGVGFLYDALAGVFALPVLHRLPRALLLTGALMALGLNVYAVATLSHGPHLGTVKRGAGLAIIAASGLLLMVLAGNLLVGGFATL